VIEATGGALSLVTLLQEMVARDASDLHLSFGTPPICRIHGALSPIAGVRALDEADLSQVLDFVT
jgi:twitching motility protein PilT